MMISHLSVLAKNFLRRMPFLPQPFPFIRVWDWHQETQKSASDRNEHIRSTVKVEQLGMKIREGRLRWYGHVMRRDQEYVGRKMMEMESPGKRRRGRPKRRFLDAVKEDMQEVGVKETDVEDRKMWRIMIRCGHP